MFNIVTDEKKFWMSLRDGVYLIPRRVCRGERFEKGRSEEPENGKRTERQMEGGGKPISEISDFPGRISLSGKAPGAGFHHAGYRTLSAQRRKVPWLQQD